MAHLLFNKLEAIFGRRILSELPQIFSILIVALSCMTSGLHFSWPSPSIPKLIANDSYVPTTLAEASYFSVISPTAMIIFAPIFAIMADAIGRKYTALFIVIPHLLSWILIAASESVILFYIARVFVGIGDAGIYLPIPMYLGETVSPKVRGSWGNCLTLFIFLGQFLINVIGSYYDIRTTACVCLIVPIVHMVLLALFMPESPYYLIMKDRKEEAKTALKKLRWSEDVEEEFKIMCMDVERQISEQGTLKDLFTIDTNRKALLITIGLRAVQQLSGVSAIMIYTQYIFEQVGGSVSKTTSSIILAGLVAVLALGAAFFVNRFGRRPMMLFSCVGCGLSLLAVTTYFYLQEFTEIDITSFDCTPLVAMLTYFLSFSTGLGIIPTLMLSELFSASIKSKALCVAIMAYGVLLMFITKLFHILTSEYGMFAAFSTFTICCLLGLLFCLKYMPETNMKTLEQIQQDLKNMK